MRTLFQGIEKQDIEALINTPAGQSEAAFAFSHWYVEGVGLVKIAADVQGTTFDMELLSVEQ